MAVIRGESCFEKNAFEDTENATHPPQLEFLKKEYLRKYSRYRKKFFFVLKLFLQPILFHEKISFDNLTYFKQYGNLNSNVSQLTAPQLKILDTYTQHKPSMYISGQRKLFMNDNFMFLSERLDVQ